MTRVAHSTGGSVTCVILMNPRQFREPKHLLQRPIRFSEAGHGDLGGKSALQ